VSELLIWDQEQGIGWCDGKPGGRYNKDYWNEYVRRAGTPMGEELTARRIALVGKWLPVGQIVVDIGIGCGQFVETRGPGTWGYDVNPHGVRWLLDRDSWWDPWFIEVNYATCWDSLEHMDRPDLFLQRVTHGVFVSIPIFRDKLHALQSKHFKPDEHFWYFTRDGLVRWMAAKGFELREENRMEEELGREDIGTFYFERVNGWLSRRI